MFSKDYSIVVPFYNEEENIRPMLERVSKVMDDLSENYEIIAIDDGSSDTTFSKLVEGKERYPKLKIIKFRRNFGQTQAMQAGIDHACGEFIITMDGDLQNDPADIPKLLEKMNAVDPRESKSAATKNVAIRAMNRTNTNLGLRPLKHTAST